MRFLKNSLFLTNFFFYLVIIFVLFNLLSCTSYKHISYFEDLPDSIGKPILTKTAVFKNPIIQPDDILTITIQLVDNNVTNLLNSNQTVNGVTSTVPITGSSPGTAGASQDVLNGYLVDKNGNVELPFTGKIHLSGLTTTAAKDTIAAHVDQYFNNAVVNVRFANFKVTVLGEVLRPASYIVPNERVSVFDAIGMAGDITVAGKKENVVLLRDSLDQKMMVRLDLNSKEIVGSPWFYLRPNDILYVEPNPYKSATVDAVNVRKITIVASSLTVLLALISLLRK